MLKPKKSELKYFCFSQNFFANIQKYANLGVSNYMFGFEGDGGQISYILNNFFLKTY